MNQASAGLVVIVDNKVIVAILEKKATADLAGIQVKMVNLALVVKMVNQVLAENLDIVATVANQLVENQAIQAIVENP